MKYYIKAPKATGLHRATAIPKTKAEAYAFSLDQMLQFAFNLDGCTLLRQSKHSQRVLTTLCCAKSFGAIKL